MSASGYTPILLYGSTTASNVPLAANLTTSASGIELAVNAADGKLFYKDSGGVVQVLASKAGNVNVSSFSAGTTGFTPNTATTGAVTLAGTLATTNGGTGLTSFTANGVVYASSTSALTTGSALTFDGTNLGLGTSTYNGRITAKNPSVSGNQVIYAIQGATSTSQLASWDLNQTTDVSTFGTDYAASLAFKINSSEQMRLTSTGLGIGTSSPLSKLTIQTQSVARLSARTTESVFGTVTGGSAWDSLNGSDSALAPFGLRGNGVYINDGTGTTTFSGGNLGLGVTPSAWGGSISKALEFANGVAIVQGYGVCYQPVNAYNNGTNWIYKNSSVASMYQNGAGAHYWSIAPSGTAGNAITFTQAMTLDASGNLLVGATAAGATGGDANYITINKGTGYGANQWIMHVTGTSSGIPYLNFGYAGNPVGSITQSGTTAVLYNLTSDQRLKTNIADAAPASALIDAIQVRQYDWKSDGSHQRYGFIAQELVTVAPEAVHQPADPEEMMAVDYSKLVPMLVKEIQDLRKRLAAAGI